MEFLSIINSLGPTAVIVLLIVLVLMQMKNQSKEMSGIAKRIDATASKQEEKDKEQDEKIAFLQQHYVTKEDLFQQFGGWRTELGNVNKQLLHITELVAKGSKE
jgi:hypothetical protein